MGRAYRALGFFLDGAPQAALAELELAKRHTSSSDGADSRIWCSWLRAATLLALHRHEEAGASLDEALTDCRKTGLVELEASILTTRARWLWKAGALDSAREALSEAQEIAERCEYRLQQADLHNLRAEIHFAVGEGEPARAEATLALERATCDGGSFAYRHGLQSAQRLLEKLDNASEP
jgi:tetratricopeptide (TPR) repeat protein